MPKSRPAASNLEEKVRRASENKERLIVRHGRRPIAAVLPYEDLVKLRGFEKELARMQERLEDEIDREEIQQVRKNPREKPKSWEAVKAEHGW